MGRVVITVDGLAASGKSALSRELAKRIGYLHFSSGALYRSIGLVALRAGAQGERAILDLMSRTKLALEEDLSGGIGVRVDGAIFGDELYTPDVSEATSLLSAFPAVRTRLLSMQRQAVPHRHLVAEGRDMGTVVFPDAPLKFFVTALAEVRTLRRLRQMGVVGDNNSLKKEIEKEISERDQRDSSRAVAPTKPAESAVIIENSAKTLTEVVESMYDFVAKRGLPIVS